MDSNASLRKAISSAASQSADEFMAEYEVSESELRVVAYYYGISFSEAASCIQIGAHLGRLTDG